MSTDDDDAADDDIMITIPLVLPRGKKVGCKENDSHEQIAIRRIPN